MLTSFNISHSNKYNNNHSNFHNNNNKSLSNRGKINDLYLNNNKNNENIINNNNNYFFENFLKNGNIKDKHNKFHNRNNSVDMKLKHNNIIIDNLFNKDLNRKKEQKNNNKEKRKIFF